MGSSHHSRDQIDSPPAQQGDVFSCSLSVQVGPHLLTERLQSIEECIARGIQRCEFYAKCLLEKVLRVPKSAGILNDALQQLEMDHKEEEDEETEDDDDEGEEDS